jgi:hypothetical protein
MRLMLKFSIPVERGNAAFADGSLGKTIEKLIADSGAEAAYLTAVDGQRGGMIFYEASESSHIPKLAEPLFPALSASIEIIPVMNAEELKRGLSA